MARLVPLTTLHARSAARLIYVVVLGGCGLTDPMPPGAERFAPPPVYARWWAMTEACSGVTRPLDAVQFYRVPHASTLPVRAGNVDAAAYYSLGRDRIVLAEYYTQEGSTVRHEMLHALLRVPGHPRAAFLGRCAGVVGCPGVCLTDAGPAPAPDPAAIRVPPESLDVSADVTPAAPSLAVDSGLFMFTVRVRNPKPYPVVVVPPAPPGPYPTYPVRYQLQVAGASGRLVTGAQAGDTDPSGYAYAPGETRQLVYDLSVAPGAAGWYTRVPGRGGAVALGPGRYALTGGYGSPWGERWSDSVVVTFDPGASDGRAVARERVTSDGDPLSGWRAAAPESQWTPSRAARKRRGHGQS